MLSMWAKWQVLQLASMTKTIDFYDGMVSQLDKQKNKKGNYEKELGTLESGKSQMKHMFKNGTQKTNRMTNLKTNIDTKEKDLIDQHEIVRIYLTYVSERVIPWFMKHMEKEYCEIMKRIGGSENVNYSRLADLWGDLRDLVPHFDAPNDEDYTG